MEELQIFQNAEFGQMRVLEMDGGSWFVAVDICKALELGNTSKSVSRLDEDEKGMISSNTRGGNQKLLTVSESGLYSLVLSCRKPEAKAFRKWITSEVLPAIRKTGCYSLQQAQTALPATIEIRREQNELKNKSMVIRINAEAADILENLYIETRRPTAQIASELIVKAYPLVKITD